MRDVVRCSNWSAKLIQLTTGLAGNLVKTFPVYFRHEPLLSSRAMTNAEVIMRVQQALGLQTNQQAEMVVTKVITAIEQVLLDHLGDDGFSIKLDSLGRFRIRHKPASVRKNPFTGQPSARSSSRAMGDCGGWSVNSSVCVSTAVRCLGTPSAGQLEPLRKPAERLF